MGPTLQLELTNLSQWKIYPDWDWSVNEFVGVPVLCAPTAQMIPLWSLLWVYCKPSPTYESSVFEKSFENAYRVPDFVWS